MQTGTCQDPGGVSAMLLKKGHSTRAPRVADSRTHASRVVSVRCYWKWLPHPGRGMADSRTHASPATIGPHAPSPGGTAAGGSQSMESVIDDSRRVGGPSMDHRWTIDDSRRVDGGTPSDVADGNSRRQQHHREPIHNTCCDRAKNKRGNTCSGQTQHVL